MYIYGNFCGHGNLYGSFLPPVCFFARILKTIVK